MSPADALSKITDAPTAVPKPGVRDQLQSALERELDAEARDRDRRADADGAPMFTDV